MTNRPLSGQPAEAEAPPSVHPWTALLLQAQAGHRQAFAQLVEQAEKPLFGFIHRKVRDRHLTEDLLAETFLKAWRTLANYKPAGCQGNTWLFMIARRLLIDHLRKKGRRGETQLHVHGDAGGAEELIDVRSETVADRADREHAAAMVRKALERLPDRYAEALDLMYLQGMDRHEVAVVLGCSLSAASTLLSRARDRLQEELKEIDP